MLRHLINALIAIAAILITFFYPYLWILSVLIIFLGWQEKEGDDE